MNIKPLPTVLPLIVSIGLVSPVAAQQPVNFSVASEETNAQERINFSGKLRMLSQRIPSAACHLDQGIDVDGATTLLIGATAEFEKILTALENGDPELNIINPETNRRALMRIAALRAEWEPLKAAAEAIIAENANADDVAFILNENLPVLSAAQLLVEQLVRQYSNPNDATAASLMLIDISGRQRMLTQKMSKESCMLDIAENTDVVLEDLEGTMRIFEASLEALQFGLPQVGILPPPNSAIATGLGEVGREWSVARPQLVNLMAGEVLDPDAQVVKFQALNTTMATMNRVVGMYAEAAK
ncbi:MAG: type IV pili methyl-accepting chemotaxis transducer N-terminal domain-containing protein [Pseudomonadota bacterium]